MLVEAGLCLFGAESCKFFWYSDFYSNSRKINVIKLEYLRTADFFLTLHTSGARLEGMIT